MSPCDLQSFTIVAKRSFLNVEEVSVVVEHDGGDEEGGGWPGAFQPREAE
jgi:hypothetical protein